VFGTPAGIRMRAANLSSEQRTLTGLISQLPLGLILTDIGGMVVFMNPAAREILVRDFGSTTDEDGRHPTLPSEISEALTYLKGLLSSEQRIYRQPFPLLTLKHAGTCELHITPYVPGETLSWQQRDSLRMVILMIPLEPQRTWKRRWHDYGLTRREVEVLHWLARGKTRKEMAGLLGLGEATVRTHLRNAYQKLGVTNQVEATTIVLREQFLEELEQLLTRSE
jgi:DNA-binding CsgD family transcriptional regulator